MRPDKQTLYESETSYSTRQVEKPDGTGIISVSFSQPAQFDYVDLAIVNGEVNGTPLTLRSATSHGVDIMSALQSQDRQYAKLAMGETIKLEYDAPPVAAGMKRSFVIVTQGRYDKAVTSTSEPTQFALAQNYPNPFNPTTEIHYSLATDQFVTLKVYDILGREVRTLVNSNQTAGEQSVAFNTSDLPSGIYTYRITAGTFSSIKRMMLVK